MGLDQLGVLIVGTPVPKEGGHTLPFITLRAITPPGVGSHRFSLLPRGHHSRGYPMQHVVNKAICHAGNHRHGSAGHNQSRGRAPKGADVQMFGGPNPIGGGR